MKAYVAETGCDPSPLIQRDLMSDEASGPENEDEDEWLQSMAVKSGCKNMRYLFSFDLIPYSVIAPSSISGLLHHMPYF